MGQLSMTVAGITTLLVTEDQLDAREVVSSLGHPPFTPALQKGLNWLEFGDNSVRLPDTWRTYNLFGLERAALASGFKYFGDHDWYRELARQQLGTQDADGSWTDSDPIIGTSYTLLFLSRGRHPIFMNKLRFDGFWANRPRDIANLAHYASTVLERPINWQVVSFKSDWTDWMDSPVRNCEPTPRTAGCCLRMPTAEARSLTRRLPSYPSDCFRNTRWRISHRQIRSFPRRTRSSRRRGCRGLATARDCCCFIRRRI
jgi:hypothetical protein